MSTTENTPSLCSEKFSPVGRFFLKENRLYAGLGVWAEALNVGSETSYDDFYELLGQGIARENGIDVREINEIGIQDKRSREPLFALREIWKIAWKLKLPQLDGKGECQIRLPRFIGKLGLEALLPDTSITVTKLLDRARQTQHGVRFAKKKRGEKDVIVPVYHLPKMMEILRREDDERKTTLEWERYLGLSENTLAQGGLKRNKAKPIFYAEAEILSVIRKFNGSIMEKISPEDLQSVGNLETLAHWERLPKSGETDTQGIYIPTPLRKGLAHEIVGTVDYWRDFFNNQARRITHSSPLFTETYNAINILNNPKLCDRHFQDAQLGMWGRPSKLLRGRQLSPLSGGLPGLKKLFTYAEIRQEAKK